MAAAYRADWANSTAATPLAITTSTLVHDVLVAWGVTDSTSGTFTWPSGFLEKFSQVNTRDAQTFGVATKSDATGSEGSVNISVSVDTLIGGILAYSGVDNTTPHDVAPVVANDNTAVASPWTISASITPVTNGCVIVALVGDDTGTSGDVTHSISTTSGTTGTWNPREDIASGFRNGAVFDCVQTTAGAITVQVTGTQAAATAGRTLVLLALRPAATASAGAAPPLPFALPWLRSAGGVPLMGVMAAQRAPDSGIATASLTATQEFPPFGLTATLAAIEAITATQTLPAFGLTAILANVEALTATQEFPAFGLAATLAAVDALTATETLPAFGLVATLVGIEAITVAHTLPVFGQSATLAETAAIAATQEFPPFGLVATLTANAPSFAVTQELPAFDVAATAAAIGAASGTQEAPAFGLAATLTNPQGVSVTGADGAKAQRRRRPPRFYAEDDEQPITAPAPSAPSAPSTRPVEVGAPSAPPEPEVPPAVERAAAPPAPIFAEPPPLLVDLEAIALSEQQLAQALAEAEQELADEDQAAMHAAELLLLS